MPDDTKIKQKKSRKSFAEKREENLKLAIEKFERAEAKRKARETLLEQRRLERENQLPWYCDLCDFTAKSSVNASAHQLSQKHLLREIGLIPVVERSE
jgi:hypothetical protein